MSVMGRDEGIDHGTPKGYRQHARRRVPACVACEEAHAAERQAAGVDQDEGGNHRWNRGAITSPTGARRLPAARDLTAREKRAVARLLASRAVDAAELRELLDAAGLTALDGLAPLEAS